MEEAKKKAQSTYNAAADSFDDPANEYWDRYGRGTVERLDLASGASVLDVACGTGASAIPVAEIVGSTGKVIGIDLAEGLLELGRTKAKAQGLQNVEFRQGDMTNLDFEDNTFDAVICVFGIFFVPDMESLVAELWRVVKPGGKLAITTWGPDLFEPMYGAFDNELKKERPDLVSDFRPWDRITTVQAVEQLLRDGGTTNITAEAEQGEQKLFNQDSWWKVVTGSGLRAAAESAGKDLAERVRQDNIAFINENNIKSISTNVIYGVAQKDE